MVTSMAPALSLPEEISGLAEGHGFLQLSPSCSGGVGTGLQLAHSLGTRDTILRSGAVR